MITRISKQALHYPVGDINDSGYFNWLLPASQSFIDACTAPTDIRQKVCAALIDSTINLIKLKPKNYATATMAISKVIMGSFFGAAAGLRLNLRGSSKEKAFENGRE